MISSKILYEKDLKPLPTILIITDQISAKNLGGISQTLYNIFESYPKENLRHLVFDNEVIELKNQHLQGDIIRVRMNFIRNMNNRIGLYINSHITRLNFFFRDLLGIQGDENIVRYKIDYILVSTTQPEKLHYAYLLKRKLNCGLITYFMDNWPSYVKYSWFSGNVQKLVAGICHDSDAMVYISEDLKNAFIEKYSIHSKNSLIVHNPVDLSITDINNDSLKCNASVSDVFTIIYAGSIWPMHADAVVLVASAVEKISQRGIPIELQVYCPLFQWDLYFKGNTCNAIVYKGFLPYDSIRPVLKSAHLLLIGSSFKEEFKALSYSSLQTKTTDYMATGLPLLSVGPINCTCNRFVEYWSCGYFFSNQDVNLMAEFLVSIINDKTGRLLKGVNSLRAVINHFTKAVVQEKVYGFIQSLSK